MKELDVDELEDFCLSRTEEKDVKERSRVEEAEVLMA